MPFIGKVDEYYTIATTEPVICSVAIFKYFNEIDVFGLRLCR